MQRKAKTASWKPIRQIKTELREKVKLAFLGKNGEKILQKFTMITERAININTKTKHIHKKITNEIYKGCLKKNLIENGCT